VHEVHLDNNSNFNNYTTNNKFPLQRSTVNAFYADIHIIIVNKTCEQNGELSNMLKQVVYIDTTALQRPKSRVIFTIL
jgi:hypothetical protein